MQGPHGGRKGPIDSILIIARPCDTNSERHLDIAGMWIKVIKAAHRENRFDLHNCVERKIQFLFLSSAGLVRGMKGMECVQSRAAKGRNERRARSGRRMSLSSALHKGNVCHFTVDLLHNLLIIMCTEYTIHTLHRHARLPSPIFCSRRSSSIDNGLHLHVV